MRNSFFRYLWSEPVIVRLTAVSVMNDFEFVPDFGIHERFKEVYFSRFPGRYFTGDGAKRDSDGYFWITGRVDDVINVSGHRMGLSLIHI